MKKSVMIVDENSEILKRLKTMLEEENISVTTAKTNKEAIDLLEKETSIDAILLRTKMPDGRDVFVPFIRKDDKTLPMDMEISSNCDREEIERFLSRLSSL
ncbi:MAG: hypothetical protein DRN18_01090 [Thermoplasmata archaeon]|nr:MAG: hypothetical protein DRN18_01090 [Thermoplasmata archaeon]